MTKTKLPGGDLLIGCIADDFTGATDLANNFVRSGMRVVQSIGIPRAALPEGTQVLVIALKSRTVPPGEAVSASLEALSALKMLGAQQIYFKYCSTFDSTPQGNIGPVIDALMNALGTDFTVATPAFPDGQRTVFKGHLFVGDVLLSDSGMKNHPLTPMTDANLMRVLQAQSQRKVGLIDLAVVVRGPIGVRERMAQLHHEGVGIAIVDAVSNEDLMRLGPALRDMPLVTAGSGIALALATNFGVVPSARAAALPSPGGTQAVVSGSCSLTSNAQVMHFIRHGGSAYALDPVLVARGEITVAEVLAWAELRLARGPVLVYSTAEVGSVKTAQATLGIDAAGALMEGSLAAISCGLVERGVRQLVVAGGETSGACVQALGISQMQIGQQIDPGVPWCFGVAHAVGDVGIHIALKSGNFGRENFFTHAFA